MKPVRTLLQTAGIKAVIAAEKPLYDITRGSHAKNRFLSSVDIPYIGSRVKIIKETETSTFIGKFNPDGTPDSGDFVILNATDLHLDEDYSLNNKTLEMLIRHIKDVMPDLVIFTGDTVLSKYQQIDAVQFGEMMERMGIYWAYVFGNHEARAEKEYFKYLLLHSMAAFPHCLSKFGRKELYGYGNFIINIMNGENELRESLVCFDSGRNISEPHRKNDGLPEGTTGYDYIKPMQISWYTGEISSLKKKYGKVSSMLYMHIPIPEYKLAFNQNLDGTFSPSGKGEILYGSMIEGIGCSAYNSHLFDAMKKNGSQAVFAGHDHVNDFAFRYDGITMVYNQCGGYNCYTLYDYKEKKVPEKDWPQGVTVTAVHGDGSFTLSRRLNSLYL